MTQYKRSTSIASAIAALTLFPALALAGGESGDTSHGTRTEERAPQGSAAPTDPDTRSAPDTRGDIDLDDMNMNLHADPVAPAPSATTAAPSRSNPNANAPAIDPSEVQKVFGMDAGVLDLKLLSTAQVRSLQQTLQQRGHYRGSIDGLMGPKTRAALTAMLAEQFALEQRLINQDQITDQLASSMGVSTTDIAPVNGVDTSSPTGRKQQWQPESAPQPSKTRPQPNANGASRPTPPDEPQNGLNLNQIDRHGTLQNVR